ncbi:hypothetical protein [Streptomyces tubercidicus]
MTSVTITTDNGKTYVDSPYHPGWPEEARNLGGRWSGGVWSFDARDEERVKALARRIYGTDGTPDPAGTVTVRISVHDVRGEGDGRPVTLYLYGREIATRYERDGRPRLGPGVILVEGGFDSSAGSHKYIQIGPKPGTVVEVRDMPRTVAHDHGLEIVDEDTAPDREALTEERERLVARLAEIDAILGN